MPRRTPTVWYKNCLYMMDDLEMVWLQSQDAGSCAVWEWVKADCWKRNSPQLRPMSKIEKDGVARNLGIDAIRFDAIIDRMMTEVNWIDADMKVRSWEKWQSLAVREADSDRQYVKYWKDKAKSEGDPELPPVLQDDKFRIAWEEYTKYRAQNKWVPLKAMSIERKWRELADWGLEGALESIEQSIRNGWQGLFVPKSLIQEKSQSRKAPTVWEATQKLKLIEEEMAALKGRHFSGPPANNWVGDKGKKAKAEWLELKEKQKKIKLTLMG